MTRFILLVLFAFFSVTGYAQDSLSSGRTSADMKNVKVSYGSLSRKGKTVFGTSIPYGKVWKACGSGYTRISFEKDGSFAGLPIKAGTYNLFLLPEEKEWTVILNSASGISGDFNYNEVKDKDVLKATLPVTKIDNVVDKLTFRFTESNLVIEWDQFQVAVPISF